MDTSTTRSGAVAMVMAGLMMLAVPQARAQSCPAGAVNPLIPYDDDAPSQTAINPNQVFVGNSRLQLSHTTTGSASIGDNAINDNHITGDIGVRVGHGGSADSTADTIRSVYEFRNPANLTQYQPVAGLTFRIHDLDAGDHVIVNAYNQSGVLIPLTTAIYSLDNSDGTSGVQYMGSNRFNGDGGDVGNRQGSVTFTFGSLQVQRVEFIYYDDRSSGTYTVAGLLACNPSLTLFKTTLGGAGGPFGFTLANTSRDSGSTATTTAANTPIQVDGNGATAGVQAHGITTVSSPVTINENALPTGWSLTGATCTNAAGATVGSLSGSTYTLPGTSTGPAAALTCTFTNTLLPRVTIRKISEGGTGTFAFSGGNGIAAQNITTTVAGTAVSGAVQTLTAASTATTITEGAPPAGYVLSGITCTGLPSGGTATNNLATRTVTLNAAATAPGANVTCTFTNQRLGTLRIVKSVPAGQGTSFNFSQSGMPATATGAPNAATATAFSLNPTTVAGSNLTATQTYTNVTPGVPITVNELNSANISQYSLVNIGCANAAGAPVGSTFPTSISNGAAAGSPIGTATVTLVPGADVTCTYNNVRNPRVVIVKNTVGGDGTFTFNQASSAGGTALSPASPISLVTSGGSATTNTTLTGLSGAATTNITITESPTAGFTLSGIACTNLTTGSALTTGTTPSATINLGSRQVVLGNVGTGSEVQCTFTNTRSAQLQLRKTWVNARINDAVNLPATSGFATNTSAFSAVANTANESDTGVAVGVAVGATGTLPTESFTTGTAGYYITTGWTCTDGSTTSNVAQGGSLTIPASSAGTTLVCTLTNTRRQATLALSKVWSGAAVNDTASLQGSGAANTAVLASTANTADETDTGAAVAVYAGDTVTLSETLGAGNVGLYDASAWACTGTSGLSGSTLTVAGADTAIVCSIGNTRQSTDLSITKTSVTAPVVAGGTVTYSLVVTNNGPAAVSNAVVTDDWTSQPGLDCSVGPATCAATGTAGTQCPSSVTPTALQAGQAIPLLPSGGVLTFTLQCAVTATGQ